LDKNQGWKGKEPIQEKRRTDTGWTEKAFATDESSVGSEEESRREEVIRLIDFASQPLTATSGYVRDVIFGGLVYHRFSASAIGLPRDRRMCR
jgi:hypothetical protein